MIRKMATLVAAPAFRCRAGLHPTAVSFRRSLSAAFEGAGDGLRDTPPGKLEVVGSIVGEFVTLPRETWQAVQAQAAREADCRRDRAAERQLAHQLQESLDYERKELTNTRNELTNTRNELAVVNERIAELEAQLRVINERIANLEAQFRVVNERIAELEGQLAGVKAELAGVKAERLMRDWLVALRVRVDNAAIAGVTTREALENVQLEANVVSQLAFFKKRRAVNAAWTYFGLPLDLLPVVYRRLDALGEPFLRELGGEIVFVYNRAHPNPPFNQWDEFRVVATAAGFPEETAQLLWDKSQEISSGLIERIK